MSTNRLLRYRQQAQRALAWLVVLFAWEAAYRIIGWKAWIFPAPSHVVAALGFLLTERSHFALGVALAISGARLVVGFAISVSMGALLGLAMWRWRGLDQMFGGLFLGLQTLPSVCWIPLAVLSFGLNERGIMFVLVMGSFFAVAIAFRDGLRAIPPIYRKAGQMLGAEGWRLYRFVIFPASLPALTSSLRHGFSFAWRSLMGAELLFMVKGQGIGYLLHQGREFSDVAQVIGVMFVMVMVGTVVDRIGFGVLERRVHARFGLTDSFGG